ncbi:MAG: YeeE/YedE family protein, partial [Acetobacteraceae bacterium]|nr:YeeE/YedE family protein [Acetobacteraceae bacterium]
APMVRGGQRPSPARLRAAIGIGLLAAVAFLLSGAPWGVTTGLTIWGAKAVAAAGVDLPTLATFWSWAGPPRMLAGSVLRNDSSLMDIGFILGAIAASAWQGAFRRQNWPPLRSLVGAALGGLLMGVGARLSYGCNIGALVGGISSGSLHGFLWLAAALPGSWIGIKLRPVFGLSAN